MEEKVNIWKANLTSGLILAMAGIVFTLVLYFLNLSLNKTAGYILVPIQLVLLYFLLKSYRNNIMHGQITYGQCIGAGVVIFVYYAIIMAVFTYILWTVIDPGLMKKYLAIAEEGMVKKGMPQASIDAGMAFTAKIMKPAIMAIFSIFGSLFLGVIYTLLVSIFVKKEGNPLIDTPAN
jgi:Protein of unknown function (DUF4199)